MPAQDFTLHTVLAQLTPATKYEVRLRAKRLKAPTSRAPSALDEWEEELRGRFKTLPAPTASAAVTFAWSGDLGGQGRCRRGRDGYPIFDRLRAASPDFFILLGDSVYEDESCADPLNEPGSAFKAGRLDEFRAKHRYQRGASALQRFLTSVPVVALWDDHEVRNNFAGPYEPLMPIGRQAFFDYWPIARHTEEPGRLYRTIRAGAAAEFFLLDTRSYRSRNADPDGSAKTMLGAAQHAWLLQGLAQSSARWKVIVSSVPLSVEKGGPPQEPGQDGWARGADGTGFETELTAIVEHLMTQRIRNVVWLTGDIHSVQALDYDVDHDGRTDFHEFTAGPLSAATGTPPPTRSTFTIQPQVREGGYDNFGLVRIDPTSFDLSIVDAEGRVRFNRRLTAQE